MTPPKKIDKPTPGEQTPTVDFTKLLERLDALEKENKELKSTSEKALLTAREAQDIAGKTDAKTSLQLSDSIAYPTGKRPGKYAEFEAMFKKYGVGEKPMKFIRKRYKGDMIIPAQDVVVYKGQVIRLVYCTNHESPFVEDHPSDPNWIPETKKIIFKNNGNESYVIANPGDPCLQRYLLVSSKNGSAYELEDKEAIAAKELERLDAIFEARQFVYQLFKEDDESAPRKFAIFTSGIRNAIDLNLKELKLLLMQKVDSDPSLVDKYEDKRKDCEIRYIYGLAEKRGILKSNGTAILNWTNTRLGALDGLPADEAFVSIVKNNPEAYVSVKQRIVE